MATGGVHRPTLVVCWKAMQVIRTTAAATATLIILAGAGCARAQPAPPAPVQPPVPPITIEEPEPNAYVTSPLAAWGKGIAFENTIQLRLVDEQGNILTRAQSTAFSPNYDKPGPWFTSIEYRVPPGVSRGFVEAFEASAEDGRALNLVRVPVRLR